MKYTESKDTNSGIIFTRNFLYGEPTHASFDSPTPDGDLVEQFQGPSGTKDGRIFLSLRLLAPPNEADSVTFS